ncbi:MAG TPA: lytic transglycosylase domain-containing protein [Thermoanaerobaculia bacterium]|nr:lytic transglycosylase domain-containing protein [Thermoanaerobaculia bacterium]
MGTHMSGKRSLNESLSLYAARLRRRAERRPLLRSLGGPGALTVVLGAALSAGGLTDALSSVHFLVEKDLEAVRVVRQDPKGSRVVAKFEDEFAAQSVFKLSAALPDRVVSRRLSLFDEQWVGGLPENPGRRDVFEEEMKRINEAIRREFFAKTLPYGDLIHEKAEKYDVDPVLVAAVIEAESRFRQRAKSPVGAKGLMQLMPRTGRWMGARDLYDPEQNVDAGVKYIKYLQQRFGGNLRKTIAAYNAGEGNVRRYGGIPPFGETQTYVRRVLRNYDRRSKQLERYGDEQLQTGSDLGLEDADAVASR